MGLNTHGRWPLLAAAGALPVSVAAGRRAELLPLAADHVPRGAILRGVAGGITASLTLVPALRWRLARHNR